ncbi:MAG: fructose-bisphosphate aldolase class 1 [Caudoviricetes sp.]|nr:MAG: fructose-bisphosphate aldolase class 1 [Caudoviricetes sp.]
MLNAPEGHQIFRPIPSVGYIPFFSYAENLVYAYRARYGDDKKAKKEAHTMQVTYNGFTGELVKLEKNLCYPNAYDLTLYDSEKQATISFTGVKMEDAKFLGGEVAFGG